MNNMEIQLHDSLSAIDKNAWNALNQDDSPFLLYEFLHALETTACLGENHGWYPRYFILIDEKQNLLAACATYIKTNSYGEFVFDWNWADAYAEQGLQYYPKLVVGIPYTPATGQRILVHPEQNYEYFSNILISAITKFAKETNLTGIHWLFTNERDTASLEKKGLQLRLGCQYHWFNNNYQTFDDFLAECTSKRRKTIRRERRSISDQRLRLETRSGDSLTLDEWHSACDFYSSTFHRKWGEASLNQAFFEIAGSTIGDRFVIIFAYYEDKPVACSIMLKSNHTLYGRYWGCNQQFQNLHFEACYYQGIEYCIRNQLKCFEPGAQGEHKIPRGFKPTKTWSAHRLFHSGFNNAIAHYLKQERQVLEERCEELHELLPFRQKDKNLQL